MQYREPGRTGWKVSTVSFGAWPIVGTWGNVKGKTMAQIGSIYERMVCP